MGRPPRNPSGRKGGGLSDEERKAQLSWLDDFPVPEFDGSRPRFKGAQTPVWSEHKAQLIQRYLHYFVMITKHGTYIDGFAGPQKRGKLDMWSARKVIESRPRWLRHFHLCELSPRSVKLLHEMKDAQEPRVKAKEPKRDIEIHQGDFNVFVHELLARNSISEKEATFCLLDQRMFECEWSTVQALASHKKGGAAKIELFYFLPQHWFGRGYAAQRDKSVIERWWGRDDWKDLAKYSDHERADILCDRFKKELHYAYAASWPIYTHAFGSRIKYHMVHASDHPEAVKLMARAYSKALDIPEPPEQFDWVGDPDFNDD